MRYLRLISLLIISISLLSFPCYAGIDFDGTDDFIALGTGPSLDGAVNFTISFWINTTSETQSYIISQRNGGYQGEYLVTMAISETASNMGAGSLYFQIYNGGGQWTGGVDSTTDIRGTGWRHIIAMRNGADGYIYIDGVQDVTNSGTAKNLDDALSVCIGKDDRGEVYFYEGQLTDMAIWNTALSTTDIEILYKSKIKGMPLQIKPDNLVAYYPLDDICDGCDLAGATFKDRAGTNDGTGSDANASGGQGRGESVLTYLRRK